MVIATIGIFFCAVNYLIDDPWIPFSINYPLSLVFIIALIILNNKNGKTSLKDVDSD